MLISELNLRGVIKSIIISESSGRYVSRQSVKSHIATQLGPTRTKISDLGISGFQQLMEEIALVETGLVTPDGRIVHDNEMEGQIKGVFQISPVAIEQLRLDTTVPTSRRNWFAGASIDGVQSPWAEQPESDIYRYLGMQTAAASMYTLYLYYEVAGKPDLSTLDGRASFWADYYNSTADAEGTAEHYKNSLSEIDEAAS
jgi:hypothetical protein